MLFLSAIFWLGTYAQAKIITSQSEITDADREHIVMKSIIGEVEKLAPYEKVEQLVKNEVVEPPRIVTPQETPVASHEVEVKKVLSPGELKVLEVKEKNKKILAERSKNLESSNKSSSTPDYIEEYKKEKAEQIKQVRDTYKEWQKIHLETLKHWDEERKKFLRRVPEYKKASFNLESEILGVNSSKAPRVLSNSKVSQLVLIPGSLSVPIQDQGKRPTCAAFASIRAIETVMKSNQLPIDLSEQYFYFASKPKCQTSPCSERGSWAVPGFLQGKRGKGPDIPREENCPYGRDEKSGNETQIPLSSNCQKGEVRVTEFTALTYIEDSLRSLEAGSPVIAGVKLSENFYDNQGLVTLKEAKLSDRKDGHSKGHAILLVGILPLPEKLWESDGRFCLIAANSWGEGWGRGGYACLTEKWMKNFEIKNAFVSVDKVEVVIE